MSQEYLYKNNIGIMLSEEVVNNVLSGKQKIIINSSQYKNILDRPIYLLSDNKCYGVILLNNSDKISVSKFNELSEKHCLTEEQRKKWWPDKQVLFSYNISKIIDKFNEPIGIENCSNVFGNFVVKDFNLINNNELSEKELNEYFNILENTDISEIKVNSSELSESIKEMNFQYYEFENIYYAVEHMFDKGSSFIVEQDYDGLPCTLIKRSEQCALYAYNKRDITLLFPELISQYKKLSNNDFALDCRIVVPDKSKIELKELIEKETKYEEQDVKLYIVDCLFYNLDVRNLDYRDRKQILQSLSYSKNIYETPYLFVDNSSDVLSGYEIMNMVNSNVIIKSNNNNDVYKINEMSESSITNHDFFSKQSGPMMYYLGFISCDGYVDMKTNRVEIHISKDDSEIIRNLQKLLGDNRKITNGFLKFKSQEMVKDLSKYDMDKLKPQRKTFNKIPEQYKWDFIRGCFDADGTISESKLQFDSGNRPMVKWMYEQLKKIGGEDVKYFDYDSTSKCTVNTEAVKRVHSKIYSGSGPSLQRKKAALQDKSQSEGFLNSKELEGETVTTSVEPVLGKKIIKKPIKTCNTEMAQKDEVIDSYKIDESSYLYFLKKGKEFIVKTEIDNEIIEFYRFEDEDKAELIFNKIKGEK
jgi:hypothetical protein